MKSYQRTLKWKDPTQETASCSKTFFDTSFKIRIRNTIASILRENLLLYLSLDIHDLSGAHHLICSLKHTFFLIISSFVPWISPRPWTCLKENVDIDEKQLFLVSYREPRTTTTKKNNNNFSFLITHFVFPFPFPIPAFSNIGICLIFKMGDFAAKRSSRCHTESFLENGSYRGQGSWIETELNGPKLAQETHTM